MRRQLNVILTCALFCLSWSQSAWAGSVNLLSLLEYEPTERDQANCGNCWVWAGTGVMEIARAAQNAGKDRLSIQFLNSCKTDRFACSGANADVFAAWYAGKGYAVPWSNNNAEFQDQDGDRLGGPAISCNSIQQSPNYPLGSIGARVIPTSHVGQATAIANIKQVLNNNRAVFMGFYLPDNNFWFGANGITTWFNSTSESAIWNPDFSCGTPWNNGGGHAVIIVGYNDDDPDPAKHYWIVLNSWGTANGRRPNGVYRMAMRVNYDCTYPVSQSELGALVFTDFSYGFPGGASCTYTLSSNSQSFGPGNGSGGVNVTTLSGCDWTVTGNPSWITVTSGSGNTGSGTMTYSVAANGGSQPREAVLTIAGKSFTVTQEGATTQPSSILYNGDFESETPEWNESSSGGYAIRTNYDLYAHSGSWFGWLGGYDEGEEMIYQDVAVPSSATSIFAEFYYLITTEEAEAIPYDQMIFAVVDPSDNTLLRSYAELSNANESADWMKSNRFDLSEFRGRTIRLIFFATTDYSSSTSFFVDDVTLSATFPQSSNLAPYQPSGWSDKITVSNTSGSRIDSDLLRNGDNLFLNWAVVNNGGVATARGFSASLYLDNVLHQTWNLNPLSVNYYVGYTDQPLGALTAGTHTLRIVADSAGNINESNETDNSYTKTIVVAAAQYSLSGTVHSGSVAGPGVGGARVTLGSKTVTANTSGAFSMSGIAPGNYPLTITAAGYASYSNPSYTVTSDLSGQHFALSPVNSTVRIEGGTQQYATLQAACTGVGNGAVILAQGISFPENLVLSQAKSFTIKGGYDPTFTSRAAHTTLAGVLKIGNGRLNCDRLKVR